MEFYTEDTIRGYWKEGYVSKTNVHNSEVSKSDTDRSINTTQLVEVYNQNKQKIVFALNFKEIEGSRKGAMFVDIIENEILSEEELNSFKEFISTGVKNDIEKSLLFTINEVEFLDISTGDNVINCGEKFCKNFSYKENSLNPYCLKIKSAFCNTDLELFLKNLPFYYAEKTSSEAEGFNYYYFKYLSNTNLTENLKLLSEISKLLITNGIPSEIEFNFS